MAQGGIPPRIMKVSLSEHFLDAQIAKLYERCHKRGGMVSMEYS